MAMRNNAGGGYGSRVVVDKPVRTGSGSRGTRPAGTAQVGLMYGNKITHMKGTTNYAGEKLHGGRSFQPVPFGNQIALNVKGGGPGTGRTLYGQGGSQGTYGAVNPGNAPAKNRDILREFGPDYKR